MYALHLTKGMVPLHTSHFEDNYPGLLITGASASPSDSKEPLGTYHRAITIVWVRDTAREAAHQEAASSEASDGYDSREAMPLLPYFTCGVEGDGNCISASALLADCRQLDHLVDSAGDDESDLPALLRSTRRQPRDELTGATPPQCEDFRSVVRKYRERYANPQLLNKMRTRLSACF